MTPTSHWERVYAGKPSDKLGWYTAHLDDSLDLIALARIAKSAPVLDVGGGASTLVDDLLERGFVDITVLDLSEKALLTARERLGNRASSVTWLASDVTETGLPDAHYGLWHDRAAFHFLTESADRLRYVERMRRALAPGGFVIVGAFASEAPPKCSGLAVERYDAATLHGVLGVDLELIEQRHSLHVTPGGVEQLYVYCLLRNPVATATA
jgi:ubiquinone/menaquinone biosynthesis C-methylase UbiE